VQDIEMYYLYAATFRCQTDVSDEWFLWQVPVIGNVDAVNTANMTAAWLLGQQADEPDGSPAKGSVIRVILKEIEVIAGPIPLVTPAVALDTMMRFGISVKIKDGDEVTDLPTGSAGQIIEEADDEIDQPDNSD
jgi:hypothetical protein